MMVDLLAASLVVSLAEIVVAWTVGLMVEWKAALLVVMSVV